MTPTLIASAALLIPVHLPPRTTVVQDQVRECRHVRSRAAGFIRVGDQLIRIISPAHVKCQWRDVDQRTIIRSF